MSIKTNKIVKMGMLCALSIVLMSFIRFPIIPAAAYLEYEPADVPILIAMFLYGPLAGLTLTIIVSFIQAISLSAASGWVGFVMHVLATGTFVVTAGLIYKNFHTYLGAIIGLIIGSLCMILIMIPCNLFFTVKFWGIPYDAVKGMLITAIIPFNLLKSGINSAAALAIYKVLASVFFNVKIKNN